MMTKVFDLFRVMLMMAMERVGRKKIIIYGGAIRRGEVKVKVDMYMEMTTPEPRLRVERGKRE